jgi:Mg/Co/Ni transporter MgtE
MTTDVLSFRSELTVEDVIRELRSRKPEPSELYSLFVTEEDDKLVGAFSLSDIIIAEPETILSNVMKSVPVFLYDDQRIDDIAETISKYNLLAVPVVDRANLLQGMVVVDDIIEDLMSKRRTYKR